MIQAISVVLQDAWTVLFLVFLEGMLSFDNALVLAVLAGKLPKDEQKKALTYGMWGAVGFRFLALSVLTYLMQAVWVKFVGAGYLLFLCGKHFLGGPEADGADRTGSYQFWRAILIIELTDIAFSSDSILASVGVSTKFWVVFLGGVLGILMMRFSAIFFIRLVEKFPNLERTAFLLVGIIGVKLMLEGLKIPHIDFHSFKNPAAWGFWGMMGFFMGTGFLPYKPLMKAST